MSFSNRLLSSISDQRKFSLSIIENALLKEFVKAFLGLLSYKIRYSFDRDAYLCKLGLKGIPISEDDDANSENGDEKNVMIVEDESNAVKNDSDDHDNDDDDDLDEEQKLMKSMGLPVAFTSDMLRIVDSDDETQVRNS